MEIRNTSPSATSGPTSFSVPLLFLDRPRRVVLQYDLVSAGTQQRFLNREAFVPRVDLDDFDVKAVVDYLDIEFRLSRKTQGRHVNRELSKIDGQKAYATPLPRVGPTTTNLFRVRFQECTAKRLRKSIEAIAAKWGVEDDPRTAEIEVSVDFYPKLPSEENLDLISGVLKRHFVPDRRLLEGDRKAPRYPLEHLEGVGGAQFLFGRHQGHSALEGNIYNPAAIDRTLYFGRNGDDVEWSLQRKDADRRKGETKLELPLAEQRGRIEVTLRGDKRRRTGLIHAEDVFRFKFESLRSQYFNFYLPTMPWVMVQAHPDLPAEGFVEVSHAIMVDVFVPIAAPLRHVLTLSGVIQLRSWTVVTASAVLTR